VIIAMASKAKSSVRKKQKSFAAAVRGVKTPSVFAKTSCTLKFPPTFAHRRIPMPKERNSFFIDLRVTDADDMEVAVALEQNCKNIIGINYREDLRVIEVVFATEEERNSYGEIAIVGKKSVYAIVRKQETVAIYVKMANIPYGVEEEVKKAIEEHWSQYGKVVDTAPHKVHGKWATRRWDLLLEVPKGKKIEAPVAFELLGSPVVSEWPKSLPSCLICKKAGHQAKKCPLKNPKAGGCSDPEKKDLRKKTEKGKNTETALEGSAKTPELPESASVSVSETASVSKSVSEPKSVTKSADSEVERPEMLVDEEKQAESEAELEEIEATVTLPPVMVFRQVKESQVEEDKEKTSGDEEMSEDELAFDFTPFYKSNTKPTGWSDRDWEVHLGSLTEEEVRVAFATREEMKTPPPLPTKDPETPRKGNKRMVKEDNVVSTGNVEYVASSGGEGVRRSGRKRKPSNKKK
jgi:hypothetical protein